MVVFDDAVPSHPGSPPSIAEGNENKDSRWLYLALVGLLLLLGFMCLALVVAGEKKDEEDIEMVPLRESSL